MLMVLTAGGKRTQRIERLETFDWRNDESAARPTFRRAMVTRLTPSPKVGFTGCDAI